MDTRWYLMIFLFNLIIVMVLSATRSPQRVATCTRWVSEKPTPIIFK
jgi:hypothetical protein